MRMGTRVRAKTIDAGHNMPCPQVQGRYCSGSRDGGKPDKAATEDAQRRFRDASIEARAQIASMNDAARKAWGR